MHLILAGVVGDSAKWLGGELLPFLIALLLNMAACLAVLAIVVFVMGVATAVACSMIDAAINHAAGIESPRKQTGEGSLDQSGDGTPET